MVPAGFTPSATPQQEQARQEAFIGAPSAQSLVSEQEIRDALLERHGEQVQSQLDNAHVAIAGLGGLGSTIAVALTRIGVGHLHLIDFDRVDMTNLNRQQYFVKDVGQYKTEALRANLLQINPYLDIAIDTTYVEAEKVASLFADDDIICEAFDVPENKSMLVNAVLEQLPSKPIVSASGMAGYASSNMISTKRIGERWYYCGDGVSAPRPNAGLMAPRVGIVACHEANMIVRIILGFNEA